MFSFEQFTDSKELLHMPTKSIGIEKLGMKALQILTQRKKILIQPVFVRRTVLLSTDYSKSLW